MSPAAAIVAVLALSGAAAADSHSAALATELTELLTKSGLDAVAAVDPDSPDRFVAALAFPDVQLLVVDATFPAPAIAMQQVAAKQYRDLYVALQQTAVARDRIFVHDMGANGLRSEGGDVVYESDVRQVIFDGAPGQQKLSDAAYRKRFAEDDERYSRMLSLLIDELKRSTGQ
jgi:hypothetical protein